MKTTARNNQGAYGWHLLCYIFSGAWSDWAGIWDPGSITTTQCNTQHVEWYLFLCLSSLLDCELFMSKVWSTFVLVSVLCWALQLSQQNRAGLAWWLTVWPSQTVSFGSNLTCTTYGVWPQAGYISFLCLSFFLHLVRIITVSFLHSCWDDPMS